MDYRLFLFSRLIKKLLYCELVPGCQPRSSELHSDTCCSLTTTEKGEHFNQDIRTGNEMDREGYIWGRRRTGEEMELNKSVPRLRMRGEED